MNFIETLADCSKDYETLRNGTPKDVFDIELSLALKSGRIVRLINGTVKYGLPVPPGIDLPLRPTVFLEDRYCRTCGKRQTAEYFRKTDAGRLRPHCRKCETKMAIKRKRIRRLNAEMESQ